MDEAAGPGLPRATSKRPIASDGVFIIRRRTAAAGRILGWARGFQQVRTLGSGSGVCLTSDVGPVPLPGTPRQKADSPHSTLSSGHPCRIRRGASQTGSARRGLGHFRLRCAVRHRPCHAAGRKRSRGEISWIISEGPAGVRSSPKAADSGIEENPICRDIRAILIVAKRHVGAAQHDDWQNQCDAQESNSCGHGSAAAFSDGNPEVRPWV